MYMTLKTGAVCRLSDNAVIPADPSNGDYAEFLKWVEIGNSPTQEAANADTVRVAEVSARLAKIDLLSVRPLRAIVAGAAQQADSDLLAELDSEAASLRAELANLTPATSE